MAAFNLWIDEPAPPKTWIWLRYTLTQDHWQLGLTCRNGCCVMVPVYATIMQNPPFWKIASPEDVKSLHQTKH